MQKMEGMDERRMEGIDAENGKEGRKEAGKIKEGTKEERKDAE